jgi:hypothetical protein
MAAHRIGRHPRSAALPLEESCYLCGATDDLTGDHVPPENLFPRPKPNNLITVACCRRCNGNFSADDEAFRVFASSVLGRSPAGARVWKEGVVDSSFRRSPKLRANVAKHLAQMVVKTDRGHFSALGITIPEDRATRYLVRLAKGLTRHFDPNIDYVDATFDVRQLLPTQETFDLLRRTFPYAERGEAVFGFWRGFADDDSRGLWVYAFYGALFFMVTIEDYKRRPPASAPEKRQ